MAGLWVVFLVLASAVQLAVGVMVGSWLPARRARRREEEQAKGHLLDLQALSSRMTDQVTRHSDRLESIRQELGAANTEAGPVSLDAVAAATARLLEANRQLEADLESTRRELAEKNKDLDAQLQVARTDGLTGLFNRRAFDDELARRYAQWRRQHTPLAVMMVDVDHFKRVNDQHGHQAGDEVLRQVAVALQKTMRDMDVVARYGGEEFAIIMPGTSLNDSQRAGERVRAAIEAAVAQVGGGKELRVTASVGLAQALPGDDTASLVSRADAALYAAKQAGRNRVFCYHGGQCRPASEPAEPPPNEDAVAVLEAQRAALEQPPPSPPAAPQPPAAPLTDPASSEAAKAERRKHERRSFAAMQNLAPYVEGRKPTPAMFREVWCEDVSSGGFSFVVDSPPEWDTVVVEFGVPPNLMYLSARVVHTTTCQEGDKARHKVGCRFIGRMQL